MWSLKDATNFAPATLLLLASVVINDVLNTVGALLLSATNLALLSKLNRSKVYTPALVLPPSLRLIHCCGFKYLFSVKNYCSVKDTRDNIFQMHLFEVLRLNILSKSIYSSVTTVNIRVKVYKLKSFSGCIANVDLFKTKPPCSGNVAGVVCDKSGIPRYSWV